MIRLDYLPAGARVWRQGSARMHPMGLKVLRGNARYLVRRDTHKAARIIDESTGRVLYHVESQSEGGRFMHISGAREFGPSEAGESLDSYRKRIRRAYGTLQGIRFVDRFTGESVCN